MASFTAVDDTTSFELYSHGETIAWNLTGSFTGSVDLERTRHPTTGPTEVLQTLSSVTSTTYKHEGEPRYYRLRCTAIGVEETITVTIAEQAGQIVQSFEDSQGVARLNIVDGGASVVGTLTVSGAASLAATTYSGNATFGVNDSGVDVTLYGDTASHYLQWDASADKLLLVGDIAVNTDKFTVAHTTGNTVIAGTGSITGDLAVGSNTFNVTAASGNTAIDGTLTVTGAQITGDTNGTVPVVTGLASTEYGNSAMHKTVFTFTDLVVTLTDVPDTGQWGAHLLYTFPAGNIAVLGAVSNLDLTLVGTEWTDAAEGDFSVATAVIGGFSIDAGEDNVIAKTAYTCAAQVAPLHGGSTAGLWALGAGTDDRNLYLNILVDDAAAHITATGTVAGTLTVTWAHLGDY